MVRSPLAMLAEVIESGSNTTVIHVIAVPLTILAGVGIGWYLRGVLEEARRDSAHSPPPQGTERP